MSLNLRYEGGFYSLGGTLYEVKIYQEGFEGKKTQVAFASDPLVIEWPETDKLEPVQSSNATIQLYSDSDRQFLDLYTAKVGSVRMDVMRDGALYWSGTMDPELYEEPFAYKSDYGVKLTFADFAILDRLRFNSSGLLSMDALLKSVLAASGIRYLSVVRKMSTAIAFSGSEPDALPDEVSFLSDNFYDEDGTSMTLREVIDETLRPFALRMIQKEGRIFVYDLNAVYTAFTPTEIYWEADDAVLSYDKLYNNVKLTFSPYHHTCMLDAKVEPDSVSGGRQLAINVNDTENIPGFNITLSDTGKGLIKAADAKYFRIDPVFSGSEDTGVAWTVKTPKTGKDQYTVQIQEASYEIGGMLMKAEKQPFVALIDPGRKNDFKIRISLDMMADVRFNPYESADMRVGKGYPNEQGDFNERLKRWCNFSYVPFRLILRNAEGTALYHYDNKAAASVSGGYDKKGYWYPGEGTWGDAYLAYYDISDREKDTGLGGWKTNKKCIGYYRNSLPSIFNKQGDGDFIELPPAAGWLDVQIGTGLPSYNDTHDDNWGVNTDIYWRIRWLLYRSIRLTLIDKNFQDIKADDVEINAWLNRDAKEELKMDTVIGCLDSLSPTALGQIFRTSDRSVMNRFSRAGQTDNLEKLLIGTIYANYASKHTVLSGTATLLPAFGIYADTNESGTYLLLSETQRLAEDISEIKIVQFEPDDYEGVEYNG